MSGQGFPPSDSSGSDAYFGLPSHIALLLAIISIIAVLITGSVAGLPDSVTNAVSFDIQLVFQIVTLSLAGLAATSLIGYFLILFLTVRLRKLFRERRSLKSVVLFIQVPKEHEILADASEAVFNSLFSVINALTVFDRIKRFFMGQEQFSFEIISSEGEINFYAYATENMAEILERQIYSQYPDADIHRVQDYNIFSPGCKAVFCELTQGKDPAYPIRSYRDLAKEAGTQQLKEITIDTLSALTNSMAKLEEGESAAVQLLFRPTGNKWQKRGQQIIKNLYEKTTPSDKKPAAQLTSGEQEQIRSIENTISKAGFESIIRIITTSSSEVRANLNLSHLLAAFEQFTNVEGNRLNKKRRISRKHFFTNFIFRYFPLLNYKPKKWLFLFNPLLNRLCGESMIFNAEELASLYHLPNKIIGTPQINWLKAKRAPAPNEVPGILKKSDGRISEVKEDVISPDRVLLGYNLYRGIRKEVCIKAEDRRRHIYSIGRTGMGKSIFMENQIYQDIVNGHGVCVVDPHGDLARKCLSLVPPWRAEDVVYFDPSDIERPMGLNMLEFSNPDEMDFAVGEMIAILYKLFGEQGFIGPRFEHIVRNSLLAIMKHPEGGTLVEMMRILTDDDYRDECLEHVTNPLVRAFWQEEMAQQVQFHKSEMLGPVLSKFGRFVSNDMMRNIIGQTKSSFNIRKIMDEEKILLINLAKGKVGDINCNLLGMIFVAKILMGALSRTDIPENERKDFYLYVDEFQNFATDSFATILSEARKYKLNLNVTHQYVGQLKEEIQKAVFGNVGTFITFRIGAPDAELIGKEVKPTFEESDLLNLQKYTAYVKLLVDGLATKPFSMHTYPPVKVPDSKITEQIQQLCRLKFGRPRKDVEEEVQHRGRFDMML
ncbi:MAG TPA: type IV secretion system DNA-binding domain-containing protein [bacterium]|nr:type IV secretion system DNA-binding domain-containing protein [bacterium]